MPRRAALNRVASAQPASFTPKDERKLKSAIGRFGRQWSTIHSNLFSSFPLKVIKAKGLDIVKSSAESKRRIAKVKVAVSKCENNLQFERLLRKFSEHRVKAYLRFLILKAVEEDYDCEQLSPSAEVDEVWHFHLLDTRHYRKTCEELCGQGCFIDHDPNGGDDIEARDARYEFAADLEEETSLSVDQPKLKKLPAPEPAATSADAAIHLKVVTQDGNEIFFKCKMTTPVSKLMNAFCQRQGICEESVRFIFDGNRLLPYKTPSELFMEDGDAIECVFAQRGC